MVVLTAPPKQPKTVTIQARVEEAVKTQLDQYAKFIESAPSYVITELWSFCSSAMTSEEPSLANNPPTERIMNLQEADSKSPRNTNEGRSNTT